ncbi:hypothetical protein MLD38_024035 [Melastoma candidum]|uniref:Uncharacterized protein n=1 Tax=Melastoma candidum TaxID=119954 RepID=A0ACB9NSL7_9MYRT|nr:hypothetical protein MLD38_024035 [Melastoma candidum]
MRDYGGRTRPDKPSSCNNSSSDEDEEEQYQGRSTGSRYEVGEMSDSPPVKWASLRSGMQLWRHGSGSWSSNSRARRNTPPRKRFMVHPDEWWYVLWTHFILIWAIYSSFFTPLEFAFFRGLPENLFLLDIAGQFAFLLDILLRFSLAFKDSRSHTMVFDRTRIAVRFLKSRFAVDLLGCMPWDAIYKASGRKEIVRYLLWIRLSRVLRVTEFFEKLEKDIRINYLCTRIAKLLVVELYCTHTAACIFYYLATTLPPSEEGYTWIGSLRMGNYDYTNFREIDIWRRYITSLYFAIVTMATVGYGEIHAVNVREMIFVMAYVSFDMILGAYLLGNMTALIVKGSRTEQFRDKMAELIGYMNRNNLGKHISNEVKDHLRLQYSLKHADSTVLQDIPNSIRTKIQQKLYEPDISKVPLFKGCSPGFIKQIAAKVHEEFFLPREVIFEQETEVDQLYILCNGNVEGIRRQDDKKEEFPINLPDHGTLGEVSILCNTTLPYTIRAVKLCQLLRLDKRSFTDTLELNFTDGRIIINNLFEGKDSYLCERLMESDIMLYILKHESELAMRLNCAAYDGDLHRLMHLIKSGANPNMSDYNGRSPLHIAASRGHDEMVAFLIEQGVCTNNADNSGSTPLLEAVKQGHNRIASLLCKSGATLNMDNAGELLCSTIAKGDLELLKRLLENGMNPNAKNYDTRTGLNIAASRNCYAAVKSLLDAGASIVPRDRWGRSALDEARANGDKNLVKLLEEAESLLRRG